MNPFLPRRRPDRVLALVVIVVVLVFGTGLTIAGWDWQTADPADRIAKHALVHGGIAIVLFCLLEVTWLHFTPRWVEQRLRHQGLLALLSIALVLPAIGAYLLYWLFIA